MQVEVVTGIDAQSQFIGFARRNDIGCDGSFFITGRIAPCVGFGIQLDAVGAGGFGAFHHLHHGVHENGNADAGVFENSDHLFEVCGMFDRIPSVVARELTRGIGYQGYLGGLIGKNKIHKTFFGAIAFDVEFGGDDLFQCVHIRVADMPLVGPWVYGDAFGAEALDVGGGFDKIGIVAPTAVAQGSQFVDVNG